MVGIVVGIYDEINSLVSYVIYASGGGSSRTMPLFLLVNPATGKIYFIEIIPVPLAEKKNL